MEELWIYFILCFTSLFLIINPISTAVILLGMTEGMKKEAKKEIVVTSSQLAWVILIFFAIGGFMIFQLFGLTLGSFKIAGGLLLFIISLDMIFKGTSDEINHEKYYSPKEDLAVIPFTIPFTSGPGAITTSIVLSTQAISMYHWAVLFLAITIAIILNYIILINAEKVREIVKEKGMKVLVKLMGILVCAIGIQFIVNGIIDNIPIILSYLTL